MKHVSRLFLLSFICLTTINAANNHKHNGDPLENGRAKKSRVQKEFDTAWVVAGLTKKFEDLLTPSPELITTSDILEQQEEEYADAISAYAAQLAATNDTTILKKQGKTSSAPASLAPSRSSSPKP